MNIAIIIISAAFIQWSLFLWMRHRKTTQHIYTLAPERHQSKSKTVSMGGIGILLSLILGWCLMGEFSATSGWVIGITLTFGGIGLIDDLISYFQKNNKGFTAKTKFIAQSTAGLIAMVILYQINPAITLWHILLGLFLFVGTSNATNLTDGLDGLLGSTFLIALMGCCLMPQFLTTDISALVLVMTIAISIFLLFNTHPAKLFMGDTGSLALGSFLAAICIQSTDPFAIIPLGTLYIIETLSVIIQVGVFKRSQKRVFLMSPLHHHFELKNWSEKRIVIVFMVIQAIGVGVWLWQG